MTHLGTPLSTAPTDGITVVRFASASNLLLAASWDTHLRLYDVEAETCRTTLKLSTPILDCNFRDEGTAFSGGLDGQVLSHDFESQVPPILLGNHQKPIKSVEYCMEKGLVVSSGWDRLVKFWDPRRAHHRIPVTSFELPSRVYTASQTATRLVIGTAEKHIFVFDLRNLDPGPVHRESGLQHQTRCLRCFKTGEGYGVTSIEGRVAIDYIEPQTDSKKYAFRVSSCARGDHKVSLQCHRKKDNGVELIYPVNAIAFHPTEGTFATGGCDGSVAIWDGENKKKITSITGYPTSIASLDFNADGTLLAIASSYTFEEGEKEGLPNTIYLRKMQEQEIQIKGRS